MSDDAHIAQLREDARHARQRFELYRARVLSSRPTSEAKLRELEQAATRTRERLEHAERERERERPRGTDAPPPSAA